jgi:protein-disulfide isomerase
MKNPWVIVGIVGVVLFGGSIALTQMFGAGGASAVTEEGVTAITHVKGNPEAVVVLEEFSDFQCPACAAAQPVLADLMDTFGDSVRLEFRNFPLPSHSFAQVAAQAAAAAGQQGTDKFFEFHDILFERQSEWTSGMNPNQHFERYAAEIGLDVELFKQHQRSRTLRAQVLSDRSEGLEREVTGTPTFFLNGEKMQYTTYQEFFEQVGRAIDPNFSLSPATEADTLDGANTPAGAADGEVRFGL